MASKQKSIITLEKKLEVIKELREGISQRCVADLYSLPKSTVGDIWKDREKMQNHVSSSDCSSFAKRRHIVREAHFEKLDKACNLCFLQQRSKGAPVSGPELKEKALHVLYRVIVDNYSELWAFLSYRHPTDLHRLDKGGLTVCHTHTRDHTQTCD